MVVAEMASAARATSVEAQRLMGRKLASSYEALKENSLDYRRRKRELMSTTAFKDWVRAPRECEAFSIKWGCQCAPVVARAFEATATGQMQP